MPVAGGASVVAFASARCPKVLCNPDCDDVGIGQYGDGFGEWDGDVTVLLILAMLIFGGKHADLLPRHGISSQCCFWLRVQQIVEVNGVLRQGLEKGLPITNLMENWDFLQVSARSFAHALPELQNLWNLGSADFSYCKEHFPNCREAVPCAFCWSRWACSTLWVSEAPFLVHL